MGEQHCINPAIEDPEAWFCDCFDGFKEKCESVAPDVKLAVCFRASVCQDQRVCDSWKALLCQSKKIKTLMVTLQGSAGASSLSQRAFDAHMLDANRSSELDAT